MATIRVWPASPRIPLPPAAELPRRPAAVPAHVHLLAGLPDDYLREIAAYFADQHVPYPAAVRPEVSTAILEAGRKLAQDGDAARPAGMRRLHGAALGGLLPGVPGLLGLPRDYIGAQIGSWKNGLRRAAEPDCMADVAAKLTPADISALAAWLSSRPVPRPTPPNRRIRSLPAECGSQARR